MVTQGERGDPSRRDLLSTAAVAAAGGAALVLSGCASGSAKPKVTTPLTRQAQAEVAVLNDALDVENRTIATYTAAIPLLGGRSHAAAKWFLAQELSHAALLATLIRQAGGQPRKARSEYDLGHPQGRKGLVSLLQSLEQAQVSAYLAALPQMALSSSRAAVAMTLAADAQHLSVFNLLLHREPFPSAFVTAGAGSASP